MMDTYRVTMLKKTSLSTNHKDVLFPKIPTELLDKWLDEYCNIELNRLTMTELIKMDEDETYREGKMSELFGRWIIWMKDLGFK